MSEEPELDKISLATSNTTRHREQARVEILEQTLWKRLGDAESLDGFAQAWLALQCKMIASARQGLVAWCDDEEGLSIVAGWPEDQRPTPEITQSAELAREQRRGIVRKLSLPEDAGLQIAIGYPVTIEERVAAVVALILAEPAEADIGVAMRQLQWGTAGLRDRVRRERNELREHSADLARIALDVTALVLEQEGFKAASHAAVTELATRCDCERVSLGFVDRGYAKVAAVSHSAEFGKRMNLIRLLGAAMDEAIDQRAVLCYPPTDDDPLVIRAHDELAHAHGAGTILSVPIFVLDHYLGAFTYERPAEMPFDEDTIDLLAGTSQLLGPLLDEKRKNDRWLIVKAGEAWRHQLTRMFGPGYLVRKVVLATLLALTALGYLATGTYRVAADARIEGKVQRALIAPFDGFLREAPVRAGETVTAGALLAALDERDLALSRLKWVTERTQNQHRYEQALSARERSEVNIITTEIQKADAQIALIDEQLARARIVAPFDGIVVSGDLSQRIGAAVRRGDALFEIAPLDAYRVILEVDEGQIADVEIGQAGALVATALPETPLPLVVTRITPVAEAREGRNSFRVEAELAQTSDRLRPGMEGVAKIEVGERRLIWIWSRSLIDQLRLWIWRWLPS